MFLKNKVLKMIEICQRFFELKKIDRNKKLIFGYNQSYVKDNQI